MLVQGKRPRELHWYHAGPMLFGDWGTSRLYVLGLCFFYTRHASLWFMLAMSVLLLAVGWAYGVICRLFPDGGGVYSAARTRSQSLAVIGALLLCADYVVTAALSALDAFHYLDLPHPHVWAAAAILAVGVTNVFGPTKAGAGALVAALATMLLTLVVALAAMPMMPSAHVTPPTGDVGQWWSQFTAIILAISGVEAIANMTGIMVEPVHRTTRRAIWPVVTEIVILNLALTVAMQAVPLDVLGDGDASQAFLAHRDDMLRLLATYYIGPAFAVGASLVFALLLLSAVNTAVTDLVSIQYMMSHDRELPSWLGTLNRFGMPYLPLAIGCLVPLVTVLAVPDVGGLADLYAIGVVGAIAVNLGTCSTNFALPIKKWERAGMMGLSVLMVVVWCTIAWEKPHALAFAMSVLALGLAGRWAAHNQDRIRAWMMQPVGLPWEVETQPKWSPVPIVTVPIVTVPIGAAPAIAAPRGVSPAVSAPSPAAPSLPPAAERPKGRIMVAARGGNPKLLSFAVQESKSRGAELFVLFVRYVAVSTFGPTVLWNSDTDAEAQSLFREAQRMCDEAGVPVRFLYSVAPDLADTILEMASTYGVDVLLLGATQRGVLWRTMKGDIIQKVAQLLPESISLLIHA